MILFAPRPKTGGPRVRRRRTELGPERWCRTCREWWPEDFEFFGLTVDPNGHRHTWCKACKDSRKRDWYERRKRSVAA